MRYPLCIALVCLLAAKARADDSCQAVLDAMTRYLSTPSHVFTITTRAPANRPEQGECSHAGTLRYVKLREQWIASPMTDAEMLQQSKENAAASKCRMLREEAADGESFLAYQVTQTDPETDSDGEYYICKHSGLPFKEEFNLAPAGARPTHLWARVEYQNIQAPAL